MVRIILIVGHPCIVKPLCIVTTHIVQFVEYEADNLGVVGSSCIFDTGIHGYSFHQAVKWVPNI